MKDAMNLWRAVDRYLLLHLPWIWMVRAHYLVVAAAVGWVLAMAAAALFPVAPNRIPVPVDHAWIVLIIAGVAALVWLGVIFRGHHGAPLRSGAQGWATPFGIAAGLTLLALPILAYTKVLDRRIAGTVDREDLRADSAAFSAVELPTAFVLPAAGRPYYYYSPYELGSEDWFGAEVNRYSRAEFRPDQARRPYIDEIPAAQANLIARIGSKYTGLTADQFLAYATLASAKRRIQLLVGVGQNSTAKSFPPHLVIVDAERLFDAARKQPTAPELSRLANVIDTCKALECVQPPDAYPPPPSLEAHRASRDFILRAAYVGNDPEAVQVKRSWSELLDATMHIAGIEQRLFDQFRENVFAIASRQVGNRSIAYTDFLYAAWVIILYAAFLIHVVAQVREQATRRVQVIIAVSLIATVYVGLVAMQGSSDEWAAYRILLGLLGATYVLCGIAILASWRYGRASSFTIAGVIGFLILTPPIVLVVGAILRPATPDTDYFEPHVATTTLFFTAVLMLTATMVQRVTNRLRALPR
jgi:hypothetical protein